MIDDGREIFNWIASRIAFQTQTFFIWESLLDEKTGSTFIVLKCFAEKHSMN